MSVITLSRESGSNGNEVAQILSQKLGYRLFDKELMAHLVKEFGLDTPAIDDEQEETPIEKSTIARFFDNLQSTLDLGHQTEKAISLEDNAPLTVSQVKELIWAAYSYDNVIIVGRGSQIVLAEQKDVLHVRVVAPLEKRILKWQERASLSYKDASRTVRERDGAHIDFVKNFFDADIRDSELYDLVVNTGKLSLEAAADLIIQALRALPSLD